MPRLTFVCYVFATCLLAGNALRAGHLKTEQIEAEQTEESEQPLLLDAKDEALMADLEAAYGGKHNFWHVQEGMCGECVSDQDMSSIMLVNKEKEWSAGIYGEIRADSVVMMLRQLGAVRGQRYYDLGSGAGKTVAIAAHFFGMNATGIEMSKDRHDVGCGALQKLQTTLAPVQSNSHAQLVQGSFFDYDISDADIIFTDSVEFTDDMMERIAQMGKSLKKGAIIATSKELPSAGFEEVNHLKFPASWGDLYVQVYEKTSPFITPLSLPAPSAAPQRCSASWAQPQHAS